MKQPKAVLFDLDGVLIDTETTYTQIWEDIEAVIPTGIENFARVIKGTTLPDILTTYYPDESRRERVVEMLREAEDAMSYPVFDGVMNFLKELKDNGIPAAIVTSSGSKKMHKIMDEQPEFASMFDAIVTDADVARSKPDPDPYLTGARKLGVDSADCVVFEDSFAGLESGRRAGAKVVALATTNPREVLENKADIVVNSFNDISLKTIEGL